MAPILLAAQACGIGINMWQNHQANKITKAGTRVEQQELDLRMEQMALQSSEQGLQNSEQLREVMASQRALMGARGQMAGVGSAGSLEQAGLRAFGADERARKLSLNFSQNQLAGQKRLLDINRYGIKAKQGADLMSKSMDMMSLNSMFGKPPAAAAGAKNISGGKGSLNGY